jgi:hypothetical protein
MLALNTIPESEAQSPPAAQQNNFTSSTSAVSMSSAAATSSIAMRHLQYGAHLTPTHSPTRSPARSPTLTLTHSPVSLYTRTDIFNLVSLCKGEPDYSSLKIKVFENLFLFVGLLAEFNAYANRNDRANTLELFNKIVTAVETQAKNVHSEINHDYVKTVLSELITLYAQIYTVIINNRLSLARDCHNQSIAQIQSNAKALQKDYQVLASFLSEISSYQTTFERCINYIAHSTVKFVLAHNEKIAPESAFHVEESVVVWFLKYLSDTYSSCYCVML